MNVFNSLGSNYDFEFALKSLFSSNNPANSEKLRKILEEKYSGNATLVYKGREAIELALKSLDLPQDSEVALNGFTCFVLYEAVVKAGLKTKFLDIDKSLNFSAKTLEQALKKSPQIKAVVIQNTLGYPCEIEEIERVCRENNLVLIEDLAHSVGAKYTNGKEAGDVGKVVTLSFSRDKIVDGVSGGAIILKKLKNKFVLKRVSLKQQMLDRLYPLKTWAIRISYSLGLGKLIHFALKKLNLLSAPVESNYYGGHSLPHWQVKLAEYGFNQLTIDLEHRKKIAKIYSQNISKKALSKKIVGLINLSSNLRFPIFVENRVRLIEFLKRNGIYLSDIWYDAPVAPKRYLRQTAYKGECPNAEKISETILNLPAHKNVSEKTALFISSKINQWLTLQ